MPPSPRRSGLGRGLAALIPAGPDTSRLEEIPLEEIRPNPRQPREAFEDEGLGALAESIRAVGVLQPVLVRPSGAGYELIAGERRWRAARRAGLASIPAVVREAGDSSILEQALVENLHREDLNPLEEAAGLRQLIDDFGLTHEEVGRRVGRSRAAISNALRLLSLPASVQSRLVSGQLTAGHARALLGLDSAGEQEALAEEVVRRGWSVRATEEAVASRAERPPVARPTRSPPAADRRKSAALLEAEASLSDYLETRVTIQPADRRGRVIIEYGSMEDLGRIWRLIVGQPERAAQ